MQGRPDYLTRLPDFPFENDASPTSRRDMLRKAEELEERMSQQVRKLQTDVTELGGLSSFVTFLDKRTVQMESQLSSLVRNCAELSGKCTGLSEDMQVQIRSNKKLDEDCRSKCRDLETRLQRAFTADFKPLEHSVICHGQQLKAIEISIQTIENSRETRSQPSSPDRQSFSSEVDVGGLSEKVQQVLVAVSKQSNADAEIRSELASLNQRLGKGHDEAECFAKDLAQALERLKELPEIRTRLEKLEESAQQFGPRDISPPRALSPTETCPLPASTTPEIRKWAASVEARLRSFKSGTSPDSGPAAFDASLTVEVSSALEACCQIQSEVKALRDEMLPFRQLCQEDVTIITSEVSSAMQSLSSMQEHFKGLREDMSQELPLDSEDAADTDMRSAIKQLSEKAATVGDKGQQLPVLIREVSSALESCSTVQSETKRVARDMERRMEIVERGHGSMKGISVESFQKLQEKAAICEDKIKELEGSDWMESINVQREAKEAEAKEEDLIKMQRLLDEGEKEKVKILQEFQKLKEMLDESGASKQVKALRDEFLQVKNLHEDTKKANEEMLAAAEAFREEHKINARKEGRPVELELRADRELARAVVHPEALAKRYSEATTEFDIKKAEGQLEEVRRQAEQFSERLVSLSRQRLNSSEDAKTSRRCHNLISSGEDVVAKEADALQSRLQRLAVSPRGTASETLDLQADHEVLRTADVNGDCRFQSLSRALIQLTNRVDDALVAKEEGRHSPAGNVTHMTDKLVSLESEVKALASSIGALGKQVAQIEGSMGTELAAAAVTDTADWHYIGT